MVSQATDSKISINIYKEEFKLVHICKKEKRAINSNEMKHSLDAIMGNYNNILKRKQNM